jgi:4-hydroxybenzoate polyprenyltransferase
VERSENQNQLSSHCSDWMRMLECKPLLMEQTRSVFRLLVPHEHGAWAMLIAPLVTGIGAGGFMSADTWLFVLTVFGFFLLRFPLMLALKSRAADARASALRWSAAYGALTFVSGALLLISTRLVALAWLGALGLATLLVYLWLAARRAEMTIWGEWMGIAGLALGTLGAYILAKQALDATAISLYLLNCLYFGGTVLYIKFKVREQPRVASLPNLQARLESGRACILYHVSVAALVAIFAATRWLPALVPVAFLLPMCKVIVGVLNKPERLNIRRLGFIELGFTLAFVLIMLMSFRGK